MKHPFKKIGFAALAVTLGLASAPALANSFPMEDSLNFRVYLDDREIGFHRFDLSSERGQQVVRTEARFDVKILFLNLYSYRHENTETWNNGCITSIESSTFDNGSDFAINGRRDGDELVVETAQGKTVLPGCVRTFAYWDPTLIDSPMLLNSQTGIQERVRLVERGIEPIEAGGETVSARRFQLELEQATIDLWYSDDSRWLALNYLTEDGRELRYRIQ